jgi:hypothetical protein
VCRVAGPCRALWLLNFDFIGSRLPAALAVQKRADGLTKSPRSVKWNRKFFSTICELKLANFDLMKIKLAGGGLNNETIRFFGA